jgi:superfamily II DNA or RNA helicase
MELEQGEGAGWIEPGIPEATASPSRYWQADVLADMVLREFEDAHSNGDRAEMRERFYLISNYYGRTLAILHAALRDRREPLLQATLHNLAALHETLRSMHAVDPGAVPSTVSLNREVRSQLSNDLIIQVLQSSPTPLDVRTITARVNERALLVAVKEPAIRDRINHLVASGHVRAAVKGGYSRTERPYATLNLDEASLMSVLGSALHSRFSSAGFGGLSDVVSRQEAFRRFFAEEFGYSQATAALFVATSLQLTSSLEGEKDQGPWPHADLIGSGYPRPYQYEAYAIFRGYGYNGQVIESPTGSGKTMIGMMCIQDWLRAMSQGQSILVLVPTVNYQQQWLGELCYKETGLKLPPHLVYTGTPTSLEEVRKRAGITPAILVMTYTSLAQTGSGIGKGGFDRDSIEIFLQGNDIKYVIFDEVHKVVDDLNSVSADVTRLLTEWLRDGSLRGAIGFSGTAAPYRPRFAKLGLQLVYVMPAVELIAYGFVAPFAEIGVPFAYSDREQRVRDLLDLYKETLRAFVEIVGSTNLRSMFASIPMEERIAIGRDLLRIYAGQREQTTLLEKRFRQWESGTGPLNLPELSLVSIVQIALGLSDAELVDGRPTTDEGRELASLSTDDQQPLMEEATIDYGPSSIVDEDPRFDEMLSTLESVRAELHALLYTAEAKRHLNVPGFGRELDREGLNALRTEPMTIAARTSKLEDLMASTITGLYSSLSDWYLSVGEGRVDSIKAIIEAERATRQVHGIIIFDRGNKILWERGVAEPGYRGVGGVFAQMLGDSRFTPLAALAGEIYMARNVPVDGGQSGEQWDELAEGQEPGSEQSSNEELPTGSEQLPEQISRFIHTEIMSGELAQALFGLATQGLSLHDDEKAQLWGRFESFLSDYVETLEGVHAARPSVFNRKVLRPFLREAAKIVGAGMHERLKARMSPTHHHMRDWISNFFDYAIIAETFRNPHAAQLKDVRGTLRHFYVVRMPEGNRKQLVYDLTARIVDAPSLPVDMIIVSPWARTGWNVIKPNVLIDATATRDVTAWQQLRGRAMRAMRTWTNECYRAMLVLMNTQSFNLDESAGLPEDARTAFRELQARTRVDALLDDATRAILLDAHRYVRGEQPVGDDSIETKLLQPGSGDFTSREREQLITELMLSRNKVTHIYEMVKAYGSTSQVRYDRGERVWIRTDPIAAKHEREYAVDPLEGLYAPGTQHAPLIYVSDPRRDIPSESQAHIASLLQGGDPKIVQGWLRAIATAPGEDPGLE